MVFLLCWGVTKKFPQSDWDTGDEAPNGGGIARRARAKLDFHVKKNICSNERRTVSNPLIHVCSFFCDLHKWMLKLCVKVFWSYLTREQRHLPLFSASYFKTEIEICHGCFLQLFFSSSAHHSIWAPLPLSKAPLASHPSSSWSWKPCLRPPPRLPTSSCSPYLCC